MPGGTPMLSSRTYIRPHQERHSNLQSRNSLAVDLRHFSPGHSLLPYLLVNQAAMMISRQTTARETAGWLLVRQPAIISGECNGRPSCGTRQWEAQTGEVVGKLERWTSTEGCRPVFKGKIDQPGLEVSRFLFGVATMALQSSRSERAGSWSGSLRHEWSLRGDRLSPAWVVGHSSVLPSRSSVSLLEAGTATQSLVQNAGLTGPWPMLPPMLYTVFIPVD
ncbi:hypothetical protein JB92DRAFT_2834169 [Gautieria morchelliformis]|nr:hypothetical protein JB92DRAFT_2834169 [Gautieria morchelliformis]